MVQYRGGVDSDGGEQEIENMARATEFCLGLDNKPGTLAKLCGTLKRANVNIDAISVSDNAECCWVRMIASPTAKAKKVLKRAGYRPCTKPVLRINAEHRPGQLEAITSKLAEAGVNINYVYGSNGPAGTVSSVIVSVDNIRKAAAAVGR